MIPILYESTETEFLTQGLGALTDAISCHVTEERNGTYELEMEYPQAGVHFEDIQNGNIIMAIPSPYRDAQPFRIYQVTKPLNGNVTVYAAHLTYDLNKIPVSPCSATSAAGALEAIKNNMEIENNFQFWTDIATSANFSAEVPAVCRSILGGQDGSILDVYGGEYEWDRFTVRLYSQRGSDSGVVIRYGKNLTGLNQDSDVSSLVTGICPYWYMDGTLVMCDPPIIYREGATTQSAVTVDMTLQFEEAPTPEQLQSAAESYITSNGVGELSESIEVEFLQLAQMSGYEGIALLEKCDLCDTVTVQYEDAGIDVSAKVVSIQTDVLLEKYDSMQIGSIRANVAQTIADQQAQISEKVNSSMMQAAVSNATNWITGGRGGYVIFRRNADGQPDEILIMDTPDIETATKVWRWNQGGLGYSSNGYNGPYETAITQDGAIVADFVSAGTLQGITIIGEQGRIGGWTLGATNLYNDFASDDGYTYRVYIQTYMEAYGTDSWIYSVQRRSTGSTGDFDGMFYIRGDGKIFFFSPTKPNIIGNGASIQIAAQDNASDGVLISYGSVVTPPEDGDSGFLGTSSKRWQYMNAYQVNSDRVSTKWATISQEGTAFVDMDFSLFGSGVVQDNFRVYGTFYAASGSIASSDRDKKKDIKTLDLEKAAEFILSLEPSEFRYQDGTSGRLHHGLIAQDVKQAMGDEDWGVYCEYEDAVVEGEEAKPKTAGIRYDELIPDIIATLKSIDQRLKKLEGDG